MREAGSLIRGSPNYWKTCARGLAHTNRSNVSSQDYSIEFNHREHTTT